MSNQRAGKSHRAALSDGNQDMRLKVFFSTVAEILETEGQEDAAYYFEQLVDHLVAGKSLPTDRREIIRVLGV